MLAEAPIAEYMQRIVQQAVDLGASDIHFEPYETSFRIRYRIDGVLQETECPDIAVKERLISCLKVMARLDIAEKRLPQDGRLTIELVGQQNRDARMSTLPTAFGEKVVLRLLAPTLSLPLENLGLEAQQLNLLKETLARPDGLVLVTGPTGSGKSATLYACLAYLNTGQRNLCTVEDPVEIMLTGVNQVPVNEKIGLSFSTALRSLLRQDPDVIMVGEMRDAVTADIAVKAAQTGHLVFSTVHTQSAHATLARLINMGIAPFNLASCLSLIIAQRLIRRLCPHCKREQPISCRQENIEPPAHTFAPVGCVVCHGSGYLGRLALFELLPLNEMLVQQALASGPALECSAGLSLKRAALIPLRRGETSLSEITALALE